MCMVAVGTGSPIEQQGGPVSVLAPGRGCHDRSRELALVHPVAVADAPPRLRHRNLSFESQDTGRAVRWQRSAIVA